MTKKKLNFKNQRLIRKSTELQEQDHVFFLFKYNSL